VNADRLEALRGVLQVIHVSQPYKQVSREWKEEPTIVELANGTRIGAGEVAVMAGPCSVESEEQIMGVAHRLRAARGHDPPRGRVQAAHLALLLPGDRRGGLKLLARAREETGMAIVTEAIDPESLDLVAEYADIVQIGARNMQNFSLLRRAGRAGKPVLLKRGMAATVKDLLLSAEYILAEGNADVILCERGVRGFDTHTRNLLDLTAIPVVKSLSHLPWRKSPPTPRTGALAPWPSVRA
jgi:3-deoxy-7-phosphoheptulonate synthase